MPDTVANQIDVKVTTIRDVPQGDVRRTREVVPRVLVYAPRPVLYAKATLNVLPDSAVAAPRLRARMEHMTRHWETRRTSTDTGLAPR